MTLRKKENFSLLAGGYMKNHPCKDEGEDSFFIAGNKSGLGIADGVGEMRNHGANPRRYADQLMLRCKNLVEECFDCTDYPPASNRSKRILEQAVKGVTAFGSSTAAVAVLDHGGQKLEVANLGDSTVCVCRRDSFTGLMRIVFRSYEQQHQFNMPYQLMNLPRMEDLPQLHQGGYNNLANAVIELNRPEIKLQDSPQDAQCYWVPLREGDLVILGTDGVFDNLFEEEISDLVSLAVSPYEAERSTTNARFLDTGVATPVVQHTDPRAISKAIVHCAFHRSNDHCTETPFERNARKAGYFAAGGKNDDLTIVAAWVVA